MKSTETRIEIEEMMFDNFTGEHNIWDNVLDLLDKHEENLINDFCKIQRRNKGWSK